MPQVTARDLISFLKANGLVEDRQSGSHLTLRNEAREISITWQDCSVYELSSSPWSNCSRCGSSAKNAGYCGAECAS